MAGHSLRQRLYRLFSAICVRMWRGLKMCVKKLEKCMVRKLLVVCGVWKLPAA